MPRVPFFHALIVLGLSISLSACAIFESRASRALESTPNFKDGYDDGCATASTKSASYAAQGSMVRDQELFRTDKAYRTGWSSGYSACRPAFTSNEPQRGPIPDPNPNPSVP